MTARNGTPRVRTELGNRYVSDETVEQFVGRGLQIGVLLSAVVVAVGGIMLLAASPAMPVSYSVFKSEPAVLRSVGAVIVGAWNMNVHAIIQLGMVLLIATPIARVALTLGAFAIQRDRTYVGITAIVLVLLLLGLVQ